MPYKILVPQYIPTEGLQPLLGAGCEFITDCGCSEDELCEAIVDCDAVLARTAKYTRRVLEAGKKLKIIGRFGVGFEKIDIMAAQELGIWVSNTPHAITNTVAEHAMGLIISVARNMSFNEREFRNGNFAIRSTSYGVELEGKTLGLIGFGKIGSCLAKKCMVGLDMKILAYDPYINENTIPEGMELSKNLKYVLNNSDFISMHLPLLPSTKGMMNKELFGEMKPTAYFINTCRGGVVAEKDMINALKTKQIAGAGLDVYEQEPPLAENELFTLPTVTMTPHDASVTVESFNRMSEHVGLCVADVLLRKTSPRWPVNKPENPRT